MKNIKSSIYPLVLIFLAFGCGAPERNLQTEIKNLEDSLFADATKMIDQTRAKKLIDLYVQFADENPNDPNAAESLFKAGDMSMNLNMPARAIQLFNRIMKDYSDYEKAPQCLFLKGYVYENDLNDLEAAKRIYEEFIEKYPDDEFADDAEISIQNLGKSPEQLIKEFEERAKQQENI